MENTQTRNRMRWAWRLWVRLGCCQSVLFFLCVSLATINRLVNKHAKEEIIEGVPQAGGRRVALDTNEYGAEGGFQFIKVATLVSESDRKANSQPIPSGDWVEVVGSNRRVFVYSAYLDRRRRPSYIRVVGIIKKRSKVTECAFWTSNLTEYRVPSTSQNIRENWNMVYSAAFILCVVPYHLQPVRVAMVANGQAHYNNSLPVIDLELQQSVGKMSVCVKPFHYNFNRAVWLVEFVEFYRLLGADKFIFYNHTVGGDVEAVLKHYVRQGLVEMLPWDLPVISQKEIRTEGIFAALNDCNLRSVGRFELTAMVDLDEFLVPRTQPTLLALIQELGTHNEYIFQNVFFYLYWPNDTSAHDVLLSQNEPFGISGKETQVPYLMTAFKTTRLTKPHKPNQRSKYIVRPQYTVEVGNHLVYEQTSSPKSVKNVPPELGLSHHYRICEFGGFDCLKQTNEVDRTTHRWLLALAHSVSVSCRLSFPSLGGCPLAPTLGSPW